MLRVCRVQQVQICSSNFQASLCATGLPKAESTEQPSGTEAGENQDADATEDVGPTITAEHSEIAANSSSVSLASKGADEETGEHPSGGDVEADQDRGAGTAGSPAAENGSEQPHLEDTAAAVSTSSKVD